ncbi:N-acetylated-alpha-linked acidic dipeptidase 2-like [Lineus longissimus]|uniref:N-acetylated-alpha-linked acidic dipeptidase 2-like n=1 Tax=Lineus longissimus TaxID=88925 RepID=UPI00315D2E38
MYRVPLMSAEYTTNGLTSHGSDSEEEAEWSDRDFVHLVATGMSDHSDRRKQKVRRKCLVITVIFGLLALGLGIVIGYFCAAHIVPASGVTNPTRDADPTIAKKLMEEMKPENIEKYLRNLTTHPHLAGTPADLRQAEQLKAFWESVGFDSVKITPYDVLLSYPNKTIPNKIVLLDENGKAVHTSQLKEKILEPDQDQKDVVPPFNAYSYAGNPSGDLVYVNYGRYEDFKYLMETAAIDVKGKIAIARYGKIFRGDKVTFAEKYGCIGVILYSDPDDYAPATAGDVAVYPNGWWLPGTGVQRGTLFLDRGDPLTPGYPSIDSAYRLSINETGIPTIPVHPIGYDDARQFLKHLAGKEVPADWKGTLNVTYRFGPGFQNPKWKIQVDVYSIMERRTTYNVLGTIRGAIEPDRYVLVGNHRDAWVFGAADPSSGTATMMEMSRAFAQVVKSGWRPRRSIIFCSWGAEEHGLVGSTEWVEDYAKNLAARSVAYLNVDIAVQGNYSFRAKCIPSLYDALLHAAKVTPNPNPAEVAAGRKTVYDTWRASFPGTGDRPRLLKLGSGSDFAHFLCFLGIPGIDLRYTYDEIKYKVSSYPLYHTVYETFRLMKKFIDSDFQYHLAVSRSWGEMARNLADSLILPLNFRDYATELEGYFNDFSKAYKDLLDSQKIKLDEFKSAINNFTKAANNFHKRVEKMDRTNPFDVRKVNDQMLQVERAFINPEGLPGRPITRHVIFAPSKTNSYAGASFPGLVDSLFEIDTHPEQWKVFKKHLSVVIHLVRSAASMLNDVVEFYV